MARKFRSDSRWIRPALLVNLSQGALVKQGSGRGTLYFIPQLLKCSTLDDLVFDQGASDVSQALGVDRRTVLRWRKGGEVSDFHKIRIAALKKKMTGFGE